MIWIRSFSHGLFVYFFKAVNRIADKFLTKKEKSRNGKWAALGGGGKSVHHREALLGPTSRNEKEWKKESAFSLWIVGSFWYTYANETLSDFLSIYSHSCLFFPLIYLLLQTLSPVCVSVCVERRPRKSRPPVKMWAR